VKMSPDAIVLFDLNASIIMANPQAAVLFGWNEKELVGMNVLDLMAPDERMRAKENMQRILKTGDVRTFGQTFLRKDGTSFPAELKIAFIRDAENKLKEAVAIINDVNERVHGETLRFENERLVLAAKVKNEFLAIMSHELRTPLNSMIGFSELLKQKIDGKLSDKQERYVNNIISSGKHLLELISDLLDLSRIQAGRVVLAMEKFSVPATIDETLILVKERASKRNVLITKEFDPTLEFMEANKQKFKHILFSLLDNAVKFSKMEGGTVTITTRKEEDMVKISVSDTGIGIKEEDAGKLFMVFQPIDSGEAKAYGSTGLGLAISKLFVELHGGMLGVKSKYGEGSTFTFTLPIGTKKRDVK
ncbi:MAG: PAS domain-containing sensor histidine kinase, partial [Candidatus Methanoperedens sp.]|nr:PAS domain-containing sensor histidine kinase [Candidatus Methanoperedens sp.]